MLRLSESRGALKVSNNGKRKKSSGQGTSFGLKLKDTVCDEKNELSAKRSSRGNEVLTSSIPLPDLNDNNTLVTNKVSGFDLNLISVKPKQLLMFCWNLDNLIRAWFCGGLAFWL